MIVIYIVIITVLISMAMALVRAIKGPTMYDHILAANSFGTKTVIIIALISDLIGDTMYLDIALVYALINFIATIAILKYFKYQSLGKS